MYEGKVCLVVGVHQIMVVLVNLNRCKLALVNNVLVGQRADVEPVVEADGVSGALSQYEQLPLKVPEVELLGVGHFWRVPGAVVRREDYKRLQNDRLTTESSRPEQTGIGGRLSPSQDSQAQGLGNIFQLPLLLLQLLGLGVEEQVAHSVLSRRRKLDANIALEILDEELEGDRSHDTSAVAVPSIRSHRTSMGHVAKKVASWQWLVSPSWKTRFRTVSSTHHR